MLQIDRGILFNDVKKILLMESGQFKDDRSIFIAYLRLMDIDVNPNSSYARKLSSSKLTVKDHLSFMRKHLSDEQFSSLQKTTVGLEDNLICMPHDWDFIKDVCSSALMADLAPEKTKYFHFLKALCVMDQTFTEQLLADPSNEQLIIERFNEEVASLMLLPGFRGDIKFSQQRFLVARLLYWAALGELYLRVFSKAYVEDLGSLKAGITLFLPSIDNNGRLIKSQEKFLYNAKTVWGKTKLTGKSNMTDHKFFQDITNAALPNRVKIADPDVSRVKKEFQRLRANTRLTLTKFETLIASLYVGRASKYSSLTAAILVPLISAFDQTQTQLHLDGLDSQQIVALFSDYDYYSELVNQQFDQYQIG